MQELQDVVDDAQRVVNESLARMTKFLDDGQDFRLTVHDVKVDMTNALQKISDVLASHPTRQPTAKKSTKKQVG